jgi:hypothetical protein
MLYRFSKAKAALESSLAREEEKNTQTAVKAFVTPLQAPL